MLKGLLFDLDGTLVDSLSTTFDAFNFGLQTVGHPTLTPEQIVKHFGPGELQIFQAIVGHDKARTAFDAALEHMDRNLGKMPLHKGVRELLDRLHQERVPLSIITGRGWESTEMILNHLGILNRFVTVIANDHVPEPKPSPRGIQLALERMQLEAPQTLYIGDSWVDIRAAQTAGSGSVAALWDWLVRREHLESHTPHHWAETPDHVWQLWLTHKESK